MKYALWAAAAALIATSPVRAGEIQFKPIDTNQLVVKPSKVAADLTSRTIQLVGNTTANQIKSDGYVKTINNLFGFRRTTPIPTQPGPSALPAPSLFPSTRYKSFNTPVMPTSMPSRR